MGAIYGFIGAIVVFFATVYLSFQNPVVMLDFKSALIVVGGTIAASVMAFPLRKIWHLLKVFARSLAGQSKINYMQIAHEIGNLAEARIKGRKAFEQATEQVTYPFLKDAAEVLFWLSADVSPEDLRETLDIRAKTHFKEYMREADFFRTIAKFPPAFGLMGTTLGMIALLQSLGSSEEALEMIGPAMAIALVTTLYGLAIANFFFLPIAENLTEQTMEDEKARMMVIEGIMKIQADKPPEYVQEHVKSFLLPSQKKESPQAA